MKNGSHITNKVHLDFLRVFSFEIQSKISLYFVL